MTSRVFEPTILPDWLARRASDIPDVAALESDLERVTYRELYQKAVRFAGQLCGLGVLKSDKVGLLCKKGISFAVALHGSMQANRTVVTLNARLTVAELSWQLKDADVRYLVHDADYADMAHELCLATGTLTLLNMDDMTVLFEPVQRTHIDLSDVLAIMYTSGTTGNPKGAMITYGNQWWSAMNSALQLGVHQNDRWLVPMPLFHMGGLSVLMRSVINGTTVVIHDKFDPETVNRALDEHSITLISVVPVMLQRMLENRSVSYPSTLRCCLLGGSAATKSLLEDCHRLNVPVSQSYGLTEANSQVTTLRPEDGLRKLGSSGKPLTVTQLEIRSEIGEKLPPLVSGEIVVRGPTVVPGYLHAQTSSFVDGWFHTGDIGYLDEEGYLFVLDRRKDLIVSGGENVYPAEVESVLSGHTLVREVGITAKVDETWGQVPVAFIVTENGATIDDEELRQYCRQRLAGYKVPSEYRFVRELPRNASGKLLRRNLREWVTKEQFQE